MIKSQQKKTLKSYALDVLVMGTVASLVYFVIINPHDCVDMSVHNPFANTSMEKQ